MFQGKRCASRQSINLVAFCSSSIMTFCEFKLWLDINDHAASFCLHIPHRIVSSALHHL